MSKTELQASLDEVSTAVVEFDKVQAGLSELGSKYKGVLFPVDTAEGMRDAREARAIIREPRYEVERIRKAAKAPVLALGRQLDAKAREITDALLAIETPIDDLIKVEENRKEHERLAKIEAEQAAARKIEEERLAAERAELERLRAEIAKRDAEERAKREADEAAARALREEAERQERAALEQQRKEQAAERARIEQENKRLADERAALERAQAEARRKAEAEESAKRAELAAEQRRREAAELAAKKAKYPGEDAITRALSDHFGVQMEVAKSWVLTLKTMPNSAA